jgi:hypothetical protein
MRPLAALASLAALSAAVAAPGAKDKDKDPPLYFPTKEGTTRVYANRVGDHETVLTDTVTKVEAKDGGFRVTTVLKGGSATESVTDVSGRGVFRVSGAGRPLPEPLPLLKLPAAAGDTWEERPGGPAGPVFAYTVGKEVEIEVPAGRFRAIPVEMKSDFRGRAQATTTWYAPGVGAVKLSSKTEAGERTQLLKSFTPGK